MNELLKNISAAAKERFPEIPFPHRKDEYWRFADLKAWNADSLFPHFSNAVPQSKAEGKLLEIEKAANENGGISIFDGQLMSFSAPAGVAVMPMEKAAERYPQEVEKFYGKAVGKFDTLATTRAQSGTAVVVESGANAELNLAVISKLGLSISSTLFILGADAKLRLVRSFAVNGESFGLNLTKFSLSKNSTLELATFKYSGDAAHSYLRDDFDVSENAKIVDAYAELGVSPSRAERNFEILGADAEIDARAFVKTCGKITHDLRTSQMHRVGGSHSDLSVKCVADGESRLAFMGLVRVEEGAQKTRAYQSCRSLALSDFAKTQASPILEIMANDVECSHGCTVSKPDPEEVFYMNQRGLTTAAALGLITKSFAQTTFEKMGIEPEF